MQEILVSHCIDEIASTGLDYVNIIPGLFY